MSWLDGIQMVDWRVHSQTNEDGLIDYIFKGIGTEDKTYVDIGSAGIGNSNTAYLDTQGWNGLLLDKQHFGKRPAVQVEVTARNVNEILEQQGVQTKFDLLSLDIDGNDWWVWEALKFTPRVVVLEYNPSRGSELAVTVPYDEDRVWDKTIYYGASLLAYQRLGSRKGMTLLHCNKLNAFFVQRNLAPPGFTNLEFNFKPRSGHRQDPRKRPWVQVDRLGRALVEDLK